MAALYPEDQFFYGTYAAADFADAEVTRPPAASQTDTALISIGENRDRLSVAVDNLVRKHTMEIQGKTDIYLSPPGVNYGNQLRRKLREFYLREQQTIFQFLEQPVADVPVASAYHTIIKRFSRPDFILDRTSIKDLAVDISGETVLPTINERLGFDLGNFTSNLGTFMNCLRETTEEIMRAEDNLKHKVAALDKLTQNVQAVLTLNSANPIYETMIKSTEAYVSEAIKQNSLEESYNAVIDNYKKLVLLKEAFNGIRIVGTATSTEPLCSVCISEAVGYCFSPCGHTFCTGCMRKQNLQCFICRQTIRERVKVFFS
jgi:hypothetical protein